MHGGRGGGPPPPHPHPPTHPPARAQLGPALAANYYVWPAAQLLNFTLVPLDLRILYVNIVSIAWTAYISNMASDDAAPAAPAQAPGGRAAAAAAAAPPRGGAARGAWAGARRGCVATASMDG
jgi:hypothetical protein